MSAGFVAVPGGSLYHEVDGAGPAVVLVHAGVANLRMWDPQVPRLAEMHTVIRYDTRGFGRSECEHVAFSNRSDLIAVMDAAAVDAAVVVGASRGGTIALDTAIESPERVQALVVVAGGVSGNASSAGGDDRDMWERVERLWEEKRWQELTDFEVEWWVDGPGQPPDRLDPSLRDMVRDWILTTYRAEKEEGLPQPLDPPAVDRLDDLSVPTLVMVGDLDDPATVESCTMLAERTGARLEVFEGAAHLPNLEQPDRFTELLLGFLDSVRQG